MEPFLILLMAVSLVVSAFATPLAVAHREISGGNTTEFVDIPTQTYTGEGIYYHADGVGACGTNVDDSALIVAVSRSVFETYPGYHLDGTNIINPICGKTIAATYNNTGVIVTVNDECLMCGAYGLAFSSTAFGLLTSPKSTSSDESVGRISITWNFS